MAMRQLNNKYRAGRDDRSMSVVKRLTGATGIEPEAPHFCCSEFDQEKKQQSLAAIVEHVYVPGGCVVLEGSLQSQLYFLVLRLVPKCEWSG